ncbi:MAG: protease family protein [Actinomycetota bacterium]|nr:protease family protein [Actinomycetota bacterium]
MTVAQPSYPPSSAWGEGDRFPQLLRTPRHRWWQPVLGIALATVTGVVIAVVVVVLVTLVAAAGGGSADPREDSLSADSPLGLLANNLVISAMIPASMLAVLVVHRQRIGWLWSVEGRFRWRLLGRLLVVAFVVVALFFAASFFLPPAGIGHVDPPPAGTLAGLLSVILLTTPLQSAAEEIGFRGYLTQAIASWFGRPLAGTLVAGAVTATLFALAHGGQEPALFLDRFAFGVIASWLVWRTGGLAAAIALHVANNLVSLGWTAATGSIEESLTASALDWPYAVLDVVMMLVFAVLAARLADRWHVQVRRPRSLSVTPEPATDGAALSPPGAVGYPDQRSSTPPPSGGEPPWGMG